MNKTVVPQRMRLKQVMTATAANLVMIRHAWRRYFAGLAAERREKAARQQRGWGA